MTSRKTKPLGKGTGNLTVNVPIHLKNALLQLAEKSGVTLPEYMRAVLIQAASGGLKIEEIGQKLFLPENITEYRIVSRLDNAEGLLNEREILRAALGKRAEG